MKMNVNQVRRHSGMACSRHRPGAVLLIVLIAMTLLVGLLFFVYNLGNQISRREDLQNTADAVATAGAGWMARSMNTIAMNNVGQAKLIATAYVLDAIPLAAELAIKELQVDPERDDSLARGLQRQLQRGVPNSRLEKGYPRSADYAKVSADAVLLMPATEPVFGPLWPGDENSQVPELDYNSVQTRIAAVGTILNSMQRTGMWSVGDAVNEYGPDSFETLDPDATAQWTANLAGEDGQFHVYAWWSSDKDGSHRYSPTTYTMVTAGGTITTTVNQNQNSGTWIHLGTCTFPVTNKTVEVRIRVQGPPDDPNRDQELTNFLQNGLEKLAREMAPSEDPDETTQYDELILLDNALNSTDEIDKETGAYDVSEVTHWDDNGKRGKCWAAALAMRDLSTTTVEKAGLLAQGNARQIGQNNNAGAAFLTPSCPELPCEEGTHDDFTPVLTGLFRVRIKEPQAATLELPIYEEVARINNLDDSLDDLAVVFRDIQSSIENIETAQEELTAKTDWTKFGGYIQTILQYVNDIESRRVAIGQRLDVADRLGTMGDRIEQIQEKLDQIQEQIDGEKNQPLLRTYLEQLAAMFEDSDAGTDLSDLAIREEQYELDEKETRLANLHHTCPGGGIPDDFPPNEYQSGLTVSVPFYRLGPYAELHHWRYTWYENTTEPGWGGDPEVGPTWGGDETLGYTIYGPYRWSLDAITGSFGMVGSHTGSLDVSRFAYYVHLGANIKLAYSYGVTHQQKIRYATRWITDYETARDFAADTENRRKIIRTRYYRPVVMSSLKWDHPDWLKDRSTFWSHMGAWETYWNGNGISPLHDPPAALWVWEPSGWYDVPARRPQAEKLNEYTWRWNRSYDDVIHERRVGLYERRSATQENAYIPWTIYLTSWYVFGGIQVAEEVTVSNPCNWPDDEDDKPYPMLMTHFDGDYVPEHDDGVRRTQFTFLGAAGRSGAANVWADRFASGVPGGQITAVAQVELFNNLSWDLWTQNWRTQLVPVTKWDEWLDTLRESRDALDTLEECPLSVQQDDLTVLRELLDIDPSMVQVFMNH